MQSELIKKDSNLMEVIEKYPEIVPILLGYGLHCVSCSFSKFDTLETGAKLHGFSNEEVKMILRDVNTIANNSKQNE
ncbi:MAG: DUF1858 domain-containing protein [Candidatus Pacearchaeota archaeon]